MSETLVHMKILERGTVPFSQLRQEYENKQVLFNLQTATVQRFLHAQAKQIAEGLVQLSAQIRFTLPESVTGFIDASGEAISARVPEKKREQQVGSFLARLRRADMQALVQERLAQLEESSKPAISLSGVLIRHATANYILHDLISRVYLPQWAAFDEQGNLLANSLPEVEAHITCMQRAARLLRFAASLSPDMVSDKEYQKKYYGLLAQLVNQGRSLACYQTQGIIQRIKDRAVAGRLSRGFDLSLPYFDDQELEIKTHNFVVIPPGRVLFSPAFVALAAWKEQVKVAQDTSLNPTTRNHLVEEIRALEEAFYSCD